MTPSKETSHMIKLVKRLLADNNINLLLCGFSIAQNLSKGLKRHFRIIGINILGQVFGKLKDSKNNIVEAAQETLKCLIGSLSIDDFMEDIRSGLDDKAPVMKCQTMRFVNNLARRRDTKVKNALKQLLDRLVKMTEDGSAEVRKQSVGLLSQLKITFGSEFVR